MRSRIEETPDGTVQVVFAEKVTTQSDPTLVTVAVDGVPSVWGHSGTFAIDGADSIKTNPVAVKPAANKLEIADAKALFLALLPVIVNPGS